VSRNAYVPFSLHATDHAPEHDEVAALPVSRSDEAFSAYGRAYVAYLDRRDLAETRRELAQVLKDAPREPVFHFVSGLVALESGAAADAERDLSRAIELGHAHPQRLAGFHLWRARTRDRLGRRSDAVADYRAALARPADAAVRAAALKGTRRPYRSTPPAVDFVLGDIAVP
jgi:Tfp pilus assembly protein PilF